jgi:hypothetical protein
VWDINKNEEKRRSTRVIKDVDGERGRDEGRRRDAAVAEVMVWMGKGGKKKDVGR